MTDCMALMNSNIRVVTDLMALVRFDAPDLFMCYKCTSLERLMQCSLDCGPTVRSRIGCDFDQILCLPDIGEESFMAA